MRSMRGRSQEERCGRGGEATEVDGIGGVAAAGKGRGRRIGSESRGEGERRTGEREVPLFRMAPPEIASFFRIEELPHFHY